MEQRQLRLGDILDDYCPRERRVTNHAVVAMIGPEVKQTRCTTCDADHEYKHAKVPRQRRKADSPAALYAQVSATAPKRVAPTPPASDAAPEAPADDDAGLPAVVYEGAGEPDAEETDEPLAAAPTPEAPESDEEHGDDGRDEGPVHRPLIRASLPRPEGQPPPSRPIPEFTIRQPGGGRPGRFRPRHARGGQQQQFQGNRSNGNVGGGQSRGGGPRQGGHQPQGSMRRHGPGRKRSK
jgi:hypothetical protein